MVPFSLLLKTSDETTAAAAALINVGCTFDAVISNGRVMLVCGRGDDAIAGETIALPALEKAFDKLVSDATAKLVDILSADP